jgi:hypothetical protein
MRISRRYESLQIGNRKLKEVAHISMLTINGYCIREIKMRVDMAKEGCNSSKLNIEHKKLVRRGLEHCIVWLRDLDNKKIKVVVFREFEM